MSRFATIQKVNEYFLSKGSKILSIITKDGEEPYKRIPYAKEKVKWTCANNSSHISISTFQTLYLNRKEFLNCRSCGISKSKTNKTYETFKEELEKESWKMISEKKEYQNTKTVMQVICKNNHNTKISYSNWSKGERSCKECKNYSKYTLEEVKKIFEISGRVLLEKEYKHNHFPMKCVCICKKETTISLCNLQKNISGCRFCTKKYPFINAKDIIEDSGCYIISTGEKEEVMRDLDKYTNSKKSYFLFWEPQFISNSTYIAYICNCSTLHYSNWRLFKNGARCPKCTRKKIEKTCLEMYGFTNAAKSPQVKAKIVSTFQERYGVNAAMQLQECVEKAKETNKKNHGGVHNLTLPEIRKMSGEAYFFLYGEKFGFYEPHNRKAREVSKEKYGHEVYIQSEQGKQYMLDKYGQEYFPHSSKFKEVMIERYGVEHFVNSLKSKKDMIEKYGVEYFINSPKLREIMLKKYGVEYAMQNIELFEKAMRNALRIKYYIMPSKKIREIQGYEKYALDLLIKQGYEENDIVTGKEIPRISYTFENKNRVYHPDIYVKSTTTLIEVKSIWTLEMDYDKNMAKFQTASKSFNFILWVFSSKGELVKEEKY